MTKNTSEQNTRNWYYVFVLKVIFKRITSVAMSVHQCHFRHCSNDPFKSYLNNCDWNIMCLCKEIVTKYLITVSLIAHFTIKTIYIQKNSGLVTNYNEQGLQKYVRTLHNKIVKQKALLWHLRLECKCCSSRRKPTASCFFFWRLEKTLVFLSTKPIISHLSGCIIHYNYRHHFIYSN